MKEKVTIEYTQERREHKEGILTLLSICFPDANFRDNFDFLTYKNPISNYEPIGFVAVSNNIVVGYRGFMAIPFVIGGQSVKFAVPFSGATHPDYRRNGIFSNLVKLSLKSYKDEYSFIFNTSSNKFSLPSYLKLNWFALGDKDYLIKKVLFNSLGNIPDKYKLIFGKEEMLKSVQAITKDSQITSKSKVRINLTNSDFVDWIFTRDNYQYLIIKTDNKPLGYICFTIDEKMCKIIHFDFIGTKSNLSYMLKYISKKFNISTFYFFTAKKTSFRAGILKKSGFYATNISMVRKLLKKELTPFIIRPTTESYDKNNLFIGNVDISDINNWDITSLYNF